MKAISTPEAYVKKNRKLVELPSGATFLIRKVPPRMLGDLLELGELTRKGNPDEMNLEYMKQLPATLVNLIPACVVEPKVTLDAADQDAIYIDDIGADDLIPLFTAIMEFTGLSKAAEAERANFR